MFFVIQENCEVEAKSAPKRRRWGTTITSDNTPAFSVSTETLKVRKNINID